MNKKITSLLLTGAMALSMGSVFAEEDIMLISEAPAEEVELISEETAAPVANYVTFTGKITAIDEEKYTLINGEEEFFFNKSALQLTLDKNGEMCELAVDDEVTLYVNGNTPMILSYPANYAPTVVVKESEIEMAINVDTYHAFGEEANSYINAAETLVLNVAEETEIIKLSREMFDGNLDGQDLVVFYNMATFSIPAQTTPVKVIVLNKAQETAPVELPATSVSVNGTDIGYNPSEGVEGMLPVRKVAEALGMQVDWLGQTREVLINSGMFSFKIDENSYVVGRMMPMTLDAAPVLVNDTTYVPYSFFTDVVGADVETVDGVMTITAQANN